MGALPIYRKPSLTVEQQLALLISRGLLVADESGACHALRNVSYYRFSAYLYPFRSRQVVDSFVPGTSFDKVWQYYRFDRRLKSVVLDAIERVEIAVRTKLVNVFTSQYGAFGYRDAANFASPVDRRRFSATLGFILPIDSSPLHGHSSWF